MSHPSENCVKMLILVQVKPNSNKSITSFNPFFEYLKPCFPVPFQALPWMICSREFGEKQMNSSLHGSCSMPSFLYHPSWQGMKHTAELIETHRTCQSSVSTLLTTDLFQLDLPTLKNSQKLHLEMAGDSNCATVTLGTSCRQINAGGDWWSLDSAHTDPSTCLYPPPLLSCDSS